MRRGRRPLSLLVLTTTVLLGAAARDGAGLLRDGRFAMLPRVVAASGVRWADDRLEAWNRSDALTVRDLVRDRRTTCTLTPLGNGPRAGRPARGIVV